MLDPTEVYELCPVCEGEDIECVWCEGELLVVHECAPA